MNRSICWLTLDMNRRDGQCSVSLGRGETGRTLKFRLYENGAPYTIPEGCYVVISGVMDNNHDGASEYVIYNDCYIQDGVVCYDITDATALGTVGVMDCQLQIMSVDGGCVCSPKFQIVVHSAVYDKETVEGSEQFFALQKLVEDWSQGDGSSGGGMEIVTVSGSTPSMSSQEIYEKHQNGVVIYLERSLPNGNTVLLDLASSTETQAIFTHTEVDVDDNNTKTYRSVISGTYLVSLTIPQAFAESSGGGSLPLSGKTVILFGEDFEYYPQVADYITEITGATVINAGIAGSTISACHSDAYENAFSGDSLIRAYCYNRWNSSSFSAQDEALASDAFPSGLNKTRCQAVVDALKAHGGGEITILVSFGKNDLVAGASLKNESSTSDSSTIYGAFSLINGAYALSQYNSVTCCSPVWAYYNDPLATQKKTAFEEKVNSVTGTSGADVITTIKEVADDLNVPFVDLLNVGFSLSNEYSLGATVGRYNWVYVSKTSISWNIARIIARELI